MLYIVHSLNINSIKQIPSPISKYPFYECNIVAKKVKLSSSRIESIIIIFLDLEVEKISHTFEYMWNINFTRRSP